MADEPESNEPVAPGDAPEPAPAEPAPAEPPSTAGGAPVLPPGWQQPEWVIAKPEPPPSTATRVIAAVAWVVGILAVLFFGRILWLFDPDFGQSGFEVGELLGVMTGAVLMGFFARWLWVGFRHRGRVLSPWALLVAIVLLAANPIYRTPITPATIAVRPIATYLKIGAPYTLIVADAATVSQLAGGFQTKGLVETEVRVINQGTEKIGYLIAVDLKTSDSDAFYQGVESGFEDTPGNEAHRETFGTKTVVVGTGGGAVAVTWAEPPYAVILYAADPESAKILATSVMDAYR